MDPVTLRTLAEMAAGLGALIVVGMAANILALRALPDGDVPECVRARIQWWSANAATVLCVGAALALSGLAWMVVV